MSSSPLRVTPLHALHVALGARMTEFAGYDMPVQYPAGIIAEHRHTREAASLFDVSHMGQVVLRGDGAAAALEALVPGDIAGLVPGAMRYTLFTNDSGGILDDLMVANGGDHLFLVVNAACKEADLDHLRRHLPDTIAIDRLDDRALLALQGPQAADVLAPLAPGSADMPFMTITETTIADVPVRISRSGYTGEDGFEISIPAGDGERIARLLLDQSQVEPAGLGARDSLRLEAGLCLYGHDLGPAITPVEAGLAWTIGRRRRDEGGFPGAATIRRQLADGPPRKRVGLRLDGRVPAREDAPITTPGGQEIGRVTSGGFGPTVGGPVAMGYVDAQEAVEGASVAVIVRDQARPAHICALPFVPHRYVKR